MILLPKLSLSAKEERQVEGIVGVLEKDGEILKIDISEGQHWYVGEALKVCVKQSDSVTII